MPITVALRPRFRALSKTGGGALAKSPDVRNERDDAACVAIDDDELVADDQILVAVVAVQNVRGRVGQIGQRNLPRNSCTDREGELGGIAARLLLALEQIAQTL